MFVCVTERTRFGFARVAPPVCHGQGMTGGTGCGEWETELGGQMLWDWLWRVREGKEGRKVGEKVVRMVERTRLEVGVSWAWCWHLSPPVGVAP